MNLEPDEEIREALTDDVRAQLPVALRGARYELEPVAGEAAAARVIAELTQYLSFGGATMTDPAKDDWLDGCLRELQDFPLGLLLESIPRARKKIKAPWEMVHWVVSDIEDSVSRLRLEEERLARLMELAA